MGCYIGLLGLKKRGYVGYGQSNCLVFFYFFFEVNENIEKGKRFILLKDVINNENDG